MKVFRSLGEYRPVKNPVVTIGTFDGVHFGHQRILERVNKRASKVQGESLLLTLWPHPRLVLQPEDTQLRLLNTLEEKSALLERFALDNLLVIPFTREFSRLSATEFIRDILVNTIKTNTLVIGYDHRFGKNREGSIEDLKECAPLYGYQLEEIPPQEVDEVKVSSTKIREALFNGNIAKANRYLGYSYFISGKVEEGDKLGKELGFPTANISVPEAFKLIPADGVYLGRVILGSGKYFGMVSIGHRPTVVNRGEKRVEVHILDFDQDIYGEKIKLEFLQWMRKDIKFDDVENLKKKMDEDKKHALELIRSV